MKRKELLANALKKEGFSEVEIDEYFEFQEKIINKIENDFFNLIKGEEAELKIVRFCELAYGIRSNELLDPAQSFLISLKDIFAENYKSFEGLETFEEFSEKIDYFLKERKEELEGYVDLVKKTDMMPAAFEHIIGEKYKEKTILNLQKTSGIREYVRRIIVGNNPLEDLLNMLKDTPNTIH